MLCVYTLKSKWRRPLAITKKPEESHPSSQSSKSAAFAHVTLENLAVAIFFFFV